MPDLLSIMLPVVLGFVLTTLIGGWWATRLQDRSWQRQNEVRLRESAVSRATTVADELARLLDKRLYRMRRLHSALAAVAAGEAGHEVVEARLLEYDGVLYEWNDRLNANLVLAGTYFGGSARDQLEDLYERFRSVGGRIEEAVRTQRRGEDVRDILEATHGEFEGWSHGSLNHRIYELGLAMMSQVREERVGRDAPQAVHLANMDDSTAHERGR